MLTLDNVHKKFGNNKVLNSFSCTVAPGDFVIIMGPNGTGKTTLFDVISGKTTPDSGSIKLQDEEIVAQSEREKSKWIGRLFQNTHLGSCPLLTVRENLAMATLKTKPARFRLANKAFPEKKLKELLSPLSLEIDHLLDTSMQALSGGQRQIITFIMSILTPPKLLLLDEPTAALDPTAATQLLSLTRQYTQLHQIPALLITHDPMIAKHLGNRLWIVKDGKIQKEFGIEKKEMNPQDFFSPINYKQLSDCSSTENLNCQDYS